MGHFAFLVLVTTAWYMCPGCWDVEDSTDKLVYS